MQGIFLDTEANGLNCYKHRTLEIAFKIVDLYDGRVIDEYQSIIAQPREVWEESDLNSLKVNGFTWELACSGKAENQVTKEILACFEKNSISRKSALFICQNPSFDRAYFCQLVSPDEQEALKWPYHWLDLASMYYSSIMLRAKNEKIPFPWEVGLSKNTIAEELDLPKEETPHRAMNGVDHLILCYRNIVGFPYEEANV